MFRELNEKRVNFFDRLSIILKQRAKINARRKDPKRPDEARLYCKALRKSFYRKVDEKHLDGALLQTKVGPIISAICVVLLLIWKFITHNPITLFFGVLGVVCGIWIYGSAIPRLYALVIEADREAAKVVTSSRDNSFRSTSAATRQATRLSTAPTREEILRQAAQRASQSNQTP